MSSAGAPTRPAIEHTWDRELSGLGAAVVVRLLFRREMLELYVDDFLLPVFLMPPSTGRVRLANHAAMAESGRSLIVDVRRWAMSALVLDLVTTTVGLYSSHDPRSCPPSNTRERGADACRVSLAC